MLHAPWYNSNSHHHDEPEEVKFRQLAEPLLHAHGVDLLFAGHVHAYERMHPVYANKTDSSGLTEINIGDGGNREGPAEGYYSQPSWSAYREAVFGHGELHVFNATHARWAWHRNSDSVDTVADDVVLVKRAALSGLSTDRGLVAFDHAGGRQAGERWGYDRHFDGRQ